MAQDVVIDLNADVGERPDALEDDRAILRSLTSANVACGFHAGNAETMLTMCETAARLGVSVGAHVSYWDRDGFGRRQVEIDRELLAAQVAEQLQILRAAAQLAGTQVRYVKAHGALYNRAARDYDHAEAIAIGICADARLPVLCLPGSAMADVAADYGIDAISEGYADRAYMPDGTLVSRDLDGSVLDRQAAVSQAVSVAKDGSARAVDGTALQLQVRSLCLHSDTPGAAALSSAIRAALQDSGVRVEAFA